MLSEINHKEKDKDNIVSLISGIFSKNTNEPIYKTKIDSQTQKANMITKGDGERGAIDQELGINIHTTEHKIGRQQGPTVEHRKIHSATYSNLYGEKRLLSQCNQ